MPIVGKLTTFVVGAFSSGFDMRSHEQATEEAPSRTGRTADLYLRRQ